MPDRKPPSAPDSDQDTTVLVSPSTGAYLDGAGTPAGTPALGLRFHPAPPYSAAAVQIARPTPLTEAYRIAAALAGLKRWCRWGCDPDALGALGGRR